VGEQAIRGQISLLKSDESYDWLGAGIYFWESDPTRAMEWAKSRIRRGQKIKTPFVVGAAIDLRNCLDLTQRENLDLLSEAHTELTKASQRAGVELPKNLDPPKHNSGDKLLRYLDCAVINYLHSMIEQSGVNGTPLQPFDTVRGLFVEGDPIYPGARIYKKTHTQVSVVSPECILGLFRVPDSAPD
jgi:hypothetical protein